MTERTITEKSVLLVDETLDDEEGEHCDALMNVATADNRAELFVTFPADATERVSFANVGMGRQPTKRGIVTVGEHVGATADPDYAEPLVEDTVTSAGNLRGLGQTISQFCQAWHEQGHAIGVCIDGLGDLLDANDPEPVFQFLHVLTGRLESVGATTHVHVDPDRVDQRQRMTFEQLFDETTHEEVELDHFIPSGSSHASDDDVANALENNTDTDELTDDDIADVLPD